MWTHDLVFDQAGVHLDLDDSHAIAFDIAGILLGLLDVLSMCIYFLSLMLRVMQRERTSLS